MEIIDRLLITLEEKGKKMADLCRFLDISTSVMANWKTRHTDPPAKYIAPICEFLKVSTDYLLTGSIPKISEQQQNLLNAYDKADEGTRKAVDKLLDL